MTVDRLALKGFRNYQSLEVSFTPGINIIYGENAQGKTNLLEAIAYLSTARSHRARYDREMIGFEAEFAELEGLIHTRQREFRVRARLPKGGRRQLTVNDVKLKTAAELSDVLHTVLFCPEDLHLVREGSLARRRFLDNSICQLRPKYAAALSDYQRLYEHKLRILRDWTEKPSLLETLDDFNDRMARCGALMVHYRAYFSQKLSRYAHGVHYDCSGGREELSLHYKTVKTITDVFASPAVLYQQLLEHQESHRAAELESRCCLSGPHKDDLELEINGLSARQFASQGQVRTAALSLKLAEREIHFESIGEYPVLLLDDVLSELDAHRQEFILNRITSGQVLITCCEEDRLAGLQDGNAVHIRGGSLVLS
jgi:DNA replication and repair protein RecF